jgi:hypothetical protein
MPRIGSFVIGTLIALSTIALARSEPLVAGIWKLSAGSNDALCTLTLASDPADELAGVALASAACASGLNTIGRWKRTPAGLELLAPDGGLVAVLKDRRGTFEGSRITDGKTLTLNH